MAESEEDHRQKILVRASHGDLWLIRKGEIPEKEHSNDPNALPERPGPSLGGHPQRRRDNNVAKHFDVSANPGVKVQIAVVDFDDTVLKNVATGPSLFGSGF